MPLTQAAATTLVPLLVRLTLAAVMIPTGWTMLTERMSDAGDAPRPADSSGALEDAGGGEASTAPATASDQSRISDQQTPSATPTAAVSSDATEASDTAPAVQVPEASDTGETSGTSDASDTSGETNISKTTDRPDGLDQGDQPAPPAIPDDLDASSNLESAGPQDAPGRDTSNERRLHEYAQIFDAAGWRPAIPLAWTLAICQLVGGAMLLLGLATRLWGLLFATAAVAFFAIDAWPILVATFGFDLDWSDWTMVTSRGGLVALATILVLTGGGAISIDRGLFRSRRGGAAGPAGGPSGEAKRPANR